MILDSSGGIGVDSSFEPFVPSIIPDDVYNLDLAGQLSGLPGGDLIPGSGFISDPTGTNAVFVTPDANPNPTGGYLSVLSDILKTANSAFSTYVSGSPAVAVPPARRPAAIASATSPNTTSVAGANNWLKYGAIVAAAVAVLAGLAYYA